MRTISSRSGLLKVFCVTIVCLLLARGAWAQEGSPSPAKQPVARVAGQAIYEDELLPLMTGQLQQLRNQEYELKSRTLDILVNQKILEAEAKKKTIPIDQMVEQEVDSKVADPTDSEIEAFYQGNEEARKRPLAEIKSQIRDYLKQTKVQQAREDYLLRLRKQADVAILLSPPRFHVDFDPSRLRGDAKASVVIVEFSDFQCPFCQRTYPVLKQMLAKYEGRVKLAYRDFPLRQVHPQAQIAAEASRCAHEQGKFWEYHDLLFSHPDKLDKAGLVDQARALKLDEKLFDSCLTSGKFTPAVEEDLQAGIKAGVGGTPAFFINGVFVNGAQPASVFEKTIDAELAALERQRASH